MDRTSHQVRVPIENDEERLAMKRGDKPPPVPERVADPSIREDHAVQEFRSNSDKHGSIVADLPSHNLWEKMGTNVEFFNVPTYQCSILSDNVVFLQPEKWLPETREPGEAYYERWKVQCRRLSHFPENSGETVTRMWFWQQRLTACRQTQGSCLRTMALWDAIQPEAMISQSKQG